MKAPRACYQCRGSKRKCVRPVLASPATRVWKEAESAVPSCRATSLTPSLRPCRRSAKISRPHNPARVTQHTTMQLACHGTPHRSSLISTWIWFITDPIASSIRPRCGPSFMRVLCPGRCCVLFAPSAPNFLQIRTEKLSKHASPNRQRAYYKPTLRTSALKTSKRAFLWQPYVLVTVKPLLKPYSFVRYPFADDAALTTRPEEYLPRSSANGK